MFEVQFLWIEFDWTESKKSQALQSKHMMVHMEKIENEYTVFNILESDSL